jgi:hypothetical protein
MGFNVSAIKGYVQANEKSLVGKAVLKSKTAKLFSLQLGVKGSANLNNLTASPVLQAGGCGITPAGTTNISKRVINTALLGVNQALCMDDLIGTQLENDIKVGLGLETMPFEQKVVEQNVAEIQKAGENLIWNGDVTITGSTYMGLTNGIVKILSTESVIDATDTVAKNVVTDAKAVIEKVISLIPDEALDMEDVTVFCGNDTYRAYVAQLQAANLYHYTANLDGGFSMQIPGYNIKLEGIGALNGKKRVYGTFASNFVLGTDLVSDSESAKLVEDEVTDLTHLKMKFNLGTQVRFPDLVVEYKGA